MKVFRSGWGLRSKLNLTETVKSYLMGQHQRELEV